MELIDGGATINNPAKVLYDHALETKACLRENKCNLLLLSLGTGYENFDGKDTSNKELFWDKYVYN